MQESQIEKYFKQRIESGKGLCIKFTSASGSGFPDRIVLIPDGKVYFVELKAPGKKPRPLQAAVHKTFLRYGHKVWVIDSKGKADEFLNAVLGAQISAESDR